MRRLALLLLLGLAGCNRHGVADVTLDADAAQRNATAAKTQADLAAADAAAQGPAPIVRDAAPARDKPVTATTTAARAETPPAEDEPDTDTPSGEAVTNQ